MEFYFPEHSFIASVCVISDSNSRQMVEQFRAFYIFQSIWIFTISAKLKFLWNELEEESRSLSLFARGISISKQEGSQSQQRDEDWALPADFNYEFNKQ